DALAVVVISLATFGEREMSCAATEKLCVEPPFERAQLPADRGLRHIERACCGRQTSPLDDPHEHHHGQETVQRANPRFMHNAYGRYVLRRSSASPNGGLVFPEIEHTYPASHSDSS